MSFLSLHHVRSIEKNVEGMRAFREVDVNNK